MLTVQKPHLLQLRQALVLWGESDNFLGQCGDNNRARGETRHNMLLLTHDQEIRKLENVQVYCESTV